MLKLYVKIIPLKLWIIIVKMVYIYIIKIIKVLNLKMVNKNKLIRLIILFFLDKLNVNLYLIGYKYKINHVKINNLIKYLNKILKILNY
jgi:hypothetical protein